MSKLTRENAILPVFPTNDLLGKEGYAVFIDGDKTMLIEDPGDEPFGVVIHGTSVDEKSSIAVASGGLSGTVKVKLGAPVVLLGSHLQVRGDATFEPQSGTGRIVCAQALETGVAGELIEAVLFRPFTT